MEVIFANGKLVNEEAKSSLCINLDDRALQYGDGVFETFRIAKGAIPMWKYHQQRLENSQDILGLPLDELLSGWDDFCAKHLTHIDNACAKLIISRGEGPRGYKVPDNPKLNWWLKITDLPVRSERETFKLTLCQHTLSRQPALAGLKHLNRLDQVIARSEWGGQDDYDEGIMFNLDGDVVEGTMSNVFWIKCDQLYTPDLSQEGVDGCVRRWLIEKHADENPVNIEKSTKLDQLLMADAVFLTNSLIGIQKVTEIDGHKISQDSLVDKLAADFSQQFIL